VGYVSIALSVELLFKNAVDFFSTIQFISNTCLATKTYGMFFDMFMNLRPLVTEVLGTGN